MNFENLVIALMVPFCFTADEICFCVMFGRLGRVSNHSHLASKTSGSIGQAPAFSMLIEIPELRTMIGKQAVSLAGLAPISRQSGKWWGKERIQG